MSRLQVYGPTETPNPIYETWKKHHNGKRAQNVPRSVEVRASLKQRVALSHHRRCAICSIDVSGGFDLHEALVKRSAVPVPKQVLIMVEENCVPICEQCRDIAHTKAGALVCATTLVEIVGGERVGSWYISLWEEHGLHIPKGLLTPKKLTTIPKAMELMVLGASLEGIELDLNEKGWLIPPRNRNFLAQIAQRWTRRRIRGVKPPAEWNGFTGDRVIEWLNNGYWLEYLEGVVG